MKVNKSIRFLTQEHTLIFLLIALFLSGGILYSYDSIIRRGAQLLIIAVSAIFFIKTLSIKNKDLIYKSWTALLLLNVFGYLFTADHFDTNHLGLLLIILTSSLPFYPIYYLAKKNKIKKEDLTRFLILVLPVVIGMFYFNKSQVLLERTSNIENVVNNTAFIFVFLIPYAFLFKKRIIAILSLLVITIFIIQGAKRGALVTGVIGLLYFSYYQLKTIDKKNRFRGYLIVFLGIFILGYFAYDFYISNEYLQQRLERIDLATGAGTSGRYAIYKEIFTEWYNSNSFINLLLGFGFAGSLKLTNGMFAHNDWLELLSNFGLLGILTYSLLFIAVYKFGLKLEIQDKIILFCILSIWFISTLFSMNYVHPYSFFQAIILAYLVGRNELSKDFIKV